MNTQRGVVKTRLQEHADRVLAEIRDEWAYQDEYKLFIGTPCEVCGRRGCGRSCEPVPPETLDAPGVLASFEPAVSQPPSPSPPACVGCGRYALTGICDACRARGDWVRDAMKYL